MIAEDEKLQGEAPEGDISNMPFEQALAELERVVGQLETGEAALDKSIALYERGAALRKRCEAELKRAEARVAMISEASDGASLELKSFGEEG